MRLLIISGRSLTLRALATALLLVLLVVAGMAFAPNAAAKGPSGTIVFQTVSGGPIYAMNPDGTSLRYLTTGIDPALSPDGRQVAFTRWDGIQHGATGSLWVINLDGSGERLILGNINQPKAPVWSPDGTRIAIGWQHGGRLEPEHKCSKNPPSEPLLADEDGNYIRVAIEIDGDEVEVKYCYTLLPHPYWGLRIVDAATGEFEDLPSDLFSYAPAWDPTNDWHLVYDGELGLVNLDLNQGTTWPLTDDPHDHSPVFSPDGSRIAVSYWQHDHWEIHVMPAPGAQAQTNADTLAGTGGGGRVRLTETPLRAIVEQRINGQESRSWNNVAPTWSPDGSQIAFLTDRTGRWEMWIMSASGADQRPLLSAGTLDSLYSEGAFEYHGVNERMLSWR